MQTKTIAALVLGAAFAAQPLLGQQTRIGLMPGGTARPAAPAPRRRTTSDYLAFAAAEAKRIKRQARNLKNAEGFRHG